MDASTIPKMQSKEVNGDGRPFSRPGVYQNKRNGMLFGTSDGDEGVAQADAITNPLWGDEWEWIREPYTRQEALDMRKAQEVKDATEAAIQEGKDAAELKAATKAAVEEAKTKTETK
jgi:hypothetical protein